MLVFQLNLDHLEERCTDRAGRELKWLLEIVAEINLYLPDDWRMTRSNNNFRIQVVGKDTPALVGHSYRAYGDEILHIIDSVFEKGFPDQYDHSAATGKSRSRFNAGTKCRHPECIVPNLYFFRPCPDDSPTPLFARQYEKVFRGKDGKPVGTLYERIEEESIITEPQKKALLEGRQINVFPYRLIAYMAPQCRSIRPKIRVINKRQVLILEDSDRRKVEMCLDEVTYEPPRKNGEVTLPLYFEIELESKGAPLESVERRARHLEKDLGLRSSPETKYQRGISLLREQGLSR